MSATKRPANGGSTSLHEVMKEVTLLIGDVTTPETKVSFTAQSRADADTIKGAINPAQAPRWTWANDHAREIQRVASGDVGELGYQIDIDSYFSLDNATGPVWTLQPDPAASSNPFELSTGASDAVAYHDFYHLQIAFEDVWAELMDRSIGMSAKAFYARWDALMNLGSVSKSPDERIAAYNAIPTDPIGGYEELEHFLNDVRIILDLPKIAPPASTGTQDRVDYENYLDSIGLSVQGALDYLDSFVKTVQFGGGADHIRDALIIGITGAISRGQTAAGGLKAHAEPTFLRLYGNYVNSIIGDLGSALTAYEAVSQRINDYHDVDAGHVQAQTLDVNTHLGNASANLGSLRTAYKANGVVPDDTNTPSVATDLNFPELEKMFRDLSDQLKERYRFDVFAPGSINYGLLLNYRQKWQPQSYQVGNLVKTIPLGPGETRKYTTKSVVKKSRNAKELDESVRSRKEDSSQSQRTDAEIFTNASQKTDFSANASGNFKIGIYDIHADTHVGGDQSAESKSTKKNQREAVRKAAQEYRDQHRLEVTTEESSESEMTSSTEIRNPNDELTVTYLFYELQRRYLVSESLHQATPVILVANDVPAPHEVDAAWLMRYDWILKRVMLDDSFIPALVYLASEFAGQESALIILELQVQHQKHVVDQLSRQVQVANQAVDAATAGVTNAEGWSLNDQRNEEYSKFVKSFFDPLGLSKAGTLDDGNSDRARIEFANQALDRAQVKLNDLNSQMRTELTALQVAVDKFTAASARHHAMQAQIDRLRVHVKDNIIYYMQAIWSHEPADQRYFRLYNLDVPVFESSVAKVTAQAPGAQPGVPMKAAGILAASNTGHYTVTAQLGAPKLLDDTKKLHQVADIDSLLGFKGNYMIFPLTDFDNYMAWYLIHNYIELDPTAGLVVSDPDSDSAATPEALEAAMHEISAQHPATFAKYEAEFEEVMVRLLSDRAEEMVIVPSEHLYIEALAGTHPILEDFKLIHRALDIKKVQAEVRHAELENMRLAARLAKGLYSDPDVEKKILIEGQKVPVTLSPGD